MPVRRTASPGSDYNFGVSTPVLRVPAIVERTLRAFVQRVRERFGERVVAIRLFGSYARGEAHADSDVDCLVLLDHVGPEDDRAITDMAADLTWQLDGVVISPMVMSAAEFEAWKGRERRTPLEIDRDGIDL
jgi:predicted nucleotidyltransferase